MAESKLRKLLDKKAFLTGDRARKAYDETDKHNALYIEWFEDDEAKVLTKELNSAPLFFCKSS